MRALIQRVSNASVTILGERHSDIKNGLLVFACWENDDDFSDSDWIIRKILNLRVFPDQKNVMNQSVQDIQGEILIISQFTLYASTKKGNRPSYLRSAKAEISKPFYDDFVKKISNVLGPKIKSGIFGADMKIDLINDGPITLLMDSKNKE
tara:strand:- start:1144 stop:1596 length:453 start_codon:yes stop_codon:yes gene_type:complete